MNRVQRGQLRGGGCVWQASEIGQDGFQDFDRICRHAENTAAFTAKQTFVVFVSCCSNPSLIFLNSRKRRSRRRGERYLWQSNPTIRGFAFPCNLRAVYLRMRFDVLSDFGRLDLVPSLSLRRRVRLWIEWLSSAVHSCPGPHSAHDRARQTAVELSKSIPRRDAWPIGRSPAGRFGVATHDASAGVGKGLDDVSAARGLRAAATAGQAESEDRECRPAVTIPRITRISRGVCRVSARDRLSTQPNDRYTPRPFEQPLSGPPVSFSPTELIRNASVCDLGSPALRVFTHAHHSARPHTHAQTRPRS